MNAKGKLEQSSGSKTKAKIKTAVLGVKTLEQLRRDMARMKTPSWLSLAPKHPGEASWGKLTADQWRTFCLVNLPVTLIRLWGSGHDALRREYRVLQNFMDLISAIKIACARRITPAEIKEYEILMHRYLVTLLELFPGTNISPYQHLSLHLGSLLEGFGPSTSWRVWAFERGNLMLQTIPTNNIFGARCFLFWVLLANFE